MKNQKTEANKRRLQRGLRPATCLAAPDSTHPKCEACDGTGQTANDEPGLSGPPMTCPDCLGIGSMAAMQKEKNRRVAEHYSTRRPVQPNATAEAKPDCAPRTCSELVKELLRKAGCERKYWETAKDERYINWLKGRESAFQEAASIAEGRMPNNKVSNPDAANPKP